MHSDSPTESVPLVRRDWSLLHRYDEEAWLERKRLLGPTEGLRLGAMLHQHARSVRPDWPSDDDRSRDLEAHQEWARRVRRADAHADR